MRASSLRRKVRLIAAAISAGVAGCLRSNSVKIARTCDTVTAGIFLDRDGFRGMAAVMLT